MSSLEDRQFRVTGELMTALGTTNLEVGDVFEVTSDPIDFAKVDEVCVETLHESLIGLEDEVNAVYSVVKRDEFVANTEEV